MILNYSKVGVDLETVLKLTKVPTNLSQLSNIFPLSFFTRLVLPSLSFSLFPANPSFSRPSPPSFPLHLIIITIHPSHGPHPLPRTTHPDCRQPHLLLIRHGQLRQDRPEGTLPLPRQSVQELLAPKIGDLPRRDPEGAGPAGSR